MFRTREKIAGSGAPNSPVIRINILNEMGNVVTGERFPETDEESPILEELLSLARKATLGEEEVLKKLLESLKRPGTFGSNDTEPPPF